MSVNDPAGHARFSGGELTLRAILLGGLITMLLAAANVYLGLKVGLTFATSMPAAVISIAVLRHFRGSNILENNIVQTIASAAGTLAAIIFVLPGLVIVGWWSGFPYVTRWAHRTRDPELAERMGILAATGLIVGESLWVVAFAGIVATSGSDQPLAIAPGAFEPFAAASGLVIFTALTIWLCRATMQRSH